MPTKNMDDFPIYGKIVLCNGVFTGQTVIETETNLIDRFGIVKLVGLSAEAQEAQERIMVLHTENAKRAEFLEDRREKGLVKMPDLNRFTFVLN